MYGCFVCIPCACRVPTEARRGYGIPGTGVMGTGKSSWVLCRGSMCSSEPSLHPLEFFETGFLHCSPGWSGISSDPPASASWLVYRGVVPLCLLCFTFIDKGTFFGVLGGLEFSMQPRIVLNSWQFCLNFLGAGIMSVYYCIWLIWERSLD